MQSLEESKLALERTLESDAMEPQSEAVNRILAGIESVDGLTKEILAKLQAEHAGRVRIEISQFTVSIYRYA